MTKKHLGRGSAVRRSLGGLKHFYGSGPQRQRGCAVKPTFAGPYSRRDAFCGHYIAGASLESPTVDSIRTYTPQSCTKEVENLYLEVATLISIYCHTAKMNILVSEAKKILNGGDVSMSSVMEVMGMATNSVRGPPLRRVSGKAFVIGPLRGHASDFANILLRHVLGNEEVECILFLGNYVDGAHQSIEVLYLIALLILYSKKKVIPLAGKHELLYPVQPENFGSLKNELIMRCMHTKEKIESYENVFRAFFNSLPIVCVVNEKFCCVAGGPASRYRMIQDIEQEKTREALKEFTVNELMDEDEERICEGSAFVASQDEGQGFRFTFNAVCNFLSRNNLLTMIVGMEYHISRPEYDSFAKPNHYKESMYFPGYILGRINPKTKLPAVVTIFSAPGFCGINKNGACFAVVSETRVDIHEVRSHPGRLFITPGTQDHAFSWAEPMMEKNIAAIMRQLVFGDITETAESNAAANRERENIMTSKMRRMCQLLKSHNLPLPEIPKH